MKRLFLFIVILCMLAGYACQDKSFIPVNYPSVQNNLHSRGIVSEASLPQGDSALFNTTGALLLKNEVFTYNGDIWSNGSELAYPSSPQETYLTALYPVLKNKNYTTENLYRYGELEDILIAKDTLTYSSKATLEFQHLFALLTIHVDRPLQQTLKEILLTVPQKVAEIIPSTGAYTLSDESHVSIQSKQEDGTYAFLLPPMNESILQISIRTNDKEYTQALEPYTFKSGHKYECNLASTDTRPGIRTAEDWIDFSLLINGKAAHYDSSKTLNSFGSMVDGEMTYRLLADITLTQEHCKVLFPIGYKENTPFQDIFDGEGHILSDLIIPDKKLNSNIVYTNFCGLFGVIGTNATIKNLHIDNASTIENPSSTRTGVLAALCYGNILNCSVQNSTVIFQGSKYTGILCGILANGHIVNCSTVNNTLIAPNATHMGGMTGEAKGYILNSYAYQNEFSTHTKAYVGGMVGNTANTLLTIENCYVYHKQSTSKYKYGAAASYASTATTRDFLYNSGDIYHTIYKIDASSVCTSENTFKYDNDFCVEGTSISTYLNNWITEKGNTLYPDLTFTTWKNLDNDSAGFQ